MRINMHLTYWNVVLSRYEQTNGKCTNQSSETDDLAKPANKIN